MCNTSRILTRKIIFKLPNIAIYTIHSNQYQFTVLQLIWEKIKWPKIFMSNSIRTIRFDIIGVLKMGANNLQYFVCCWGIPFDIVVYSLTQLLWSLKKCMQDYDSNSEIFSRHTLNILVNISWLFSSVAFWLLLRIDDCFFDSDFLYNLIIKILLL